MMVIETQKLNPQSVSYKSVVPKGTSRRVVLNLISSWSEVFRPSRRHGDLEILRFKISFAELLRRLYRDAKPDEHL